MVIRFRCYNCEHLFGIGDESAGRQLDCPSCGRTLNIPRHDGFASPARTPHPARSARILAACETLRPTPVRSKKSTAQTKRASLKRAWQILSRIEPVVERQDDPPAPPKVTLPDSTTGKRVGSEWLRPQWLPLIIVVPLAWLFGSWYGANSPADSSLYSANSSVQQVERPQPLVQKDSVAVTQSAVGKEQISEIQISGRLRYRTETGQFQPNAGAYLLLLPEINKSGDLIPTSTVEEADVEELAEALVAQVGELGGAIASTNSEGEYIVTLNEAGTYHAVVLSEMHITEGVQELTSEWSSTLESYFAKPKDVLAVRRIHVEQVEIAPDRPHVFDVDLERS